MNCTAALFIRDNTHGNLVVSARQRKDGGFSYEMEAGWTNSLSPRESERLASIIETTGFQIRFKDQNQ